MTTRTPLVTVVTPAFDSERFVGSAIDSVLSQTRGDLEHLVVDDGSSDGTRRVVEERARGDSRVRLLTNQREKGPAGARNTAIMAARGRYIAFLDSDDIWYPDKLDAQLDLLERSGAPLVYSPFDYIDEAGEPLGRTRAVPDSVDHERLLRANVIGCLTAIYDRQAVGRILMPPIRMRQDWGLWLRVLRASGSAALALPESMAALRLRSGSLSSNKLRATWYSLVLLVRHERVGVPRAIWSVLAHNLWRIRSG